MSTLAIAVLLALFLFVAPTLLRANEVCAFSVRRGRVLLLRGRTPQKLVSEIEDVVKRAGVDAATIRVVKEGGSPRLLATGVDEPTAQRLRNVLGATPYKLFAGARPPKGRNLGQILGIEWLAWRLLENSSRRR